MKIIYLIAVMMTFGLTSCAQTDSVDLPKDLPLPETFEEKKPMEVADCMLIRKVKLPISKKANIKQTTKIALLKTCLTREEAMMSLPMMQVNRKDKFESRPFMVEKTFESKKEAVRYAKENGITDVAMD